MSTATVCPPAAAGDDFGRLTAGYGATLEERPARASRWVSKREAIAQGLGYRRHRTREREQ